MLFRSNNNFTLLNSKIGTVDYTTGKVEINKLLVSQYTSYISIYMRTMNKDIIMNQKNILFIDLEDVSVNMLEILK